jgi:PIN domain nuclease of toxin-antitoxin system
MKDDPAGLLDTHILVWAKLDPDQLNKRQREFLEAVEAREGRIAISAITLWEIAMMASSKRHLRVKASLPSLLEDLENSPWIRVLPINAAVAAESVAIRPQLATDPADQIIVATARVFRLPLLTADERIVESNLASIF